MRLREEQNSQDLIGLTPIEQVAQELVDFSGSAESRLFYIKAANVLGPELARQAMGEIRYRVQVGQTRDRARHLTYTLRTWMVERGWTPNPTERVLAQNLPRVSAQTPPASHITFDDAKPPADLLADDSAAFPVPFGRDVFPWVLCVNNDFFTLTNEKARADKVETEIVVKGKPYRVTMLRGRGAPADSERGLLTTQHMRVLMAVVKIWSAQHTRPKDEEGNPVTVIEKGGERLCFVKTTVADIAKEMGLGELGLSDFQRLTRKIRDIGFTAYCFLLRDVPELRAAGGAMDKSFQFFGEVDTTEIETRGARKGQVKIFFSSTYSRWLLRREVVTRPLAQIKIRGDIALKLYVYLYPILAAKKSGEEFPIELARLIKNIGLKRTGWHMYKSQRRREFEKAVREIHGMPTADGRAFHVEIVQGLNREDFVLVARFVKSDAPALEGGK